MPNRILREGVVTSERVNALDCEAEVFYRRLMSVVDDFGRYTGHLSLLRAALYPLRLGAVSEDDIERMTKAVEKAGLIVVYECSGKRFLELLDFRQQVRAKDSKCPPPPVKCAASAKQVHSKGTASAHLDVSVFGDVSEGVSARKRATPSQKAPLPPDFVVSEKVKAWAAENGFGMLDEHLDAFKRKCAAHGYVYKDYDSAFMEAVREDWAKLRKVNGQAQPTSTERAAESQAWLREQEEHARTATKAPPALKAMIAAVVKTT